MRSVFRPTGSGDRQTTPNERRRAFGILFVSLICLGMGQSVMFAIMPPVSRALGLSEFQVGGIFAISATIWIFSSPFWGMRSDIVGRRPMMLLGLNAFAISTSLFALFMWLGLAGTLPVMASYVLMIAARALYGIFGSGTYPAAQAYIADRTTREERTGGVATISAAFGLGVAVGPGVGSLFARIDVLAPFYVVAILAWVSALAIYIYLPERTPPKQTEQERQVTLRWTDSRILPFLIFGTALSSVGALPIQLFGFFLIDMLKMPIEQAAEFAGVGLMASSMAALFAQFVLVQRLRLSSRDLIRWGVVVGLISNALFVFGDSYGSLIFAMVLSGLGFGMSRPGYAAAASLAVKQHEQGAVAGFTGSTGGAGFIFAPLIGNLLYQYDPLAPFALGAVIMAVLLAIAFVSPRFRNMTDIVDEEAGDTQVPKS